MIGLTAGVTYKFSVKARNSKGYSDFSAEIQILAAQEPSAPLAPSTSVSGEYVIIEWKAPNANGSPILGYKVLIRQSDETTFSEEQISCDGSQLAIVDAEQC